MFRSDVERLFVVGALGRCVIAGRRELPPRDDVTYVGFVDSCGGSADSFTVPVAHIERSIAALDAVRERKPPFSPDNVVKELSELLVTYGITSVHGDRDAGEWPRGRFRVHGIDYVPADLTRSDLYLPCFR
jgi:hypothetical protein